MAFDHSACPHCRRLREELEEAREELRQERESSEELRWYAPLEFGLTDSQCAILAKLVHRQLSDIWTLYEATRIGIRANREIGYEYNCTQVQLTKLRQKLKPYGIQIKNSWGRGYFISESDRQRLKNWPKERATEAAMETANG